MIRVAVSLECTSQGEEHVRNTRRPFFPRCLEWVFADSGIKMKQDGFSIFLTGDTYKIHR
jgi:hypothetical protein